MYNKIIKALEAGERVLVQNEDGGYQIFSTDKDNSGDFRCSGWRENRERANEEVGCCVGYSLEDLRELTEEEKWKIIDSYVEPIPILKPGTKVLIKDNARKKCIKRDLSWNENKEKMVGEICEVYNYNSAFTYSIYSKDKSTWQYFPRTAFTVLIDEEEEDDKMQEAMDLLKEKGYQIVKK